MKPLTVTAIIVFGVAGIAGLTSACGGKGATGVTGPSSSSSGGTSTGSGVAPGTAVFTQSPLGLSDISVIVPIGNLNPPDHTLPTNHAYFFHPSQANAEVRALSAGTIRNLTRGSGGADDQLNIAVSTHLQYYLGHVLLDAAIVQNQQVAAGQSLGVTTSAAGAMDLGVINDTITLFFVRPDRYIPGTLHAD